jgi:hypothetical protein
MPRQVDARPGHKPTPDELDRLQRQLLARAVAVIMSPAWGKPKARPADDTGKGSNGV